MAEEPEKKIEESLRTYARKRREDSGPPLEMHPATRRMLQGEVARLKAAQPARRPWWQSPLLIWPRFAAAIGMVAVLATGIWVFTQSENRKLNQAAQEASYGRVADRFDSVDYDVKKKDVAESLAEADHLSVSEELGRRAAVKKPAEVMLNEASSRQLRDSEIVPPATTAPSRPVVITELRREKQIALDAPAQQPVSTSGTVLEQKIGDKSGNISLFKETDAQTKRFFQVQDGRFVQAGDPLPKDWFGVDPNIAITSGVSLSAISQPVETYYFAFPVTNVNGTFANLGYLEAPRANLGDTNQAAALAVATFSDSASLPAATTVPVTEWAAAPRSDVAKNELVRARGFAGTALGVEFEREDRRGPAVLQKFQLEQQANGRITIRDADGSVYEGQILAAKVDGLEDLKAKDETRELDRKLAVPAAVPAAPMPASVSFRASGTNRNKELVVINGQLLREEDELARTQLSAGKAAAEPAGGVVASATPAPTQPQRGSRAANTREPERLGGVSTSAPAFTPTLIRGRVQIGQTNQLELRAIRSR
jgi:hypothetical protein